MAPSQSSSVALPQASGWSTPSSVQLMPNGVQTPWSSLHRSVSPLLSQQSSQLVASSMKPSQSSSSSLQISSTAPQAQPSSTTPSQLSSAPLHSSATTSSVVPSQSSSMLLPHTSSRGSPASVQVMPNSVHVPVSSGHRSGSGPSQHLVQVVSSSTTPSQSSSTLLQNTSSVSSVWSPHPAQLITPSLHASASSPSHGNPMSKP